MSEMRSYYSAMPNECLFVCTQAPRSRRKRQWPEQLSLAAKKRLLATHPCGAPLQKGGDVKTQPRGRKEGDGGLLHLPSEGTPRAAGEPRRHAKTNGYPASQPISGSLVDSAEVQTSEVSLDAYDRLLWSHAMFASSAVFAFPEGS